MNWTTIGIAVASAVLVDLQGYSSALNEWNKREDGFSGNAPPKPKFRFDLLAIRAVIGFLTGVTGAKLTN